MNIKINIFSFFLFIFVSSGAFAQYKYDIGIKTSSFDQERFQLEQRFHLKSPYTLVATYAFGPKQMNIGQFTQLLPNSNITEVFYWNHTFSNTLKFGVQRKLSVFATDVFYAGAQLGVGLKKYRSYFEQIEYLSTPNNLGEYQQVGEYKNYISHDLLQTQLALSIGMNVPLTKRFSINAEVSIASIWENRLKTYSSAASLIYFNLAASGGLRYSFGKRE